MSINPRENRNFSETGHAEAVSIVIETDACVEEYERIDWFSCPIYGTLSRKDKLTPRCGSTLMTHVSIPSETNRVTLTKMSISLVINEDN